MPRVAAYVPDIIDRSKIATAVRDVRFVGHPDELRGVDADLVVVDLARPGVLEALRHIGVRTIGFGSHVQHELLEEARTAGCDEVLPRSQFFRRLPELLS